MLVISCSICCDPLLADKVVILKCGHLFHEDCLTEWIKRSKTCPECRTRTKKPVRVFPNFLPDDFSAQLIQNEANFTNEREFIVTDLSQQFAEKKAEFEESLTSLMETKSKVIDLQNEIIILEERISDLLFEKSNAKLKEQESIVMLDKCQQELKYTQQDLKRRNELMESFRRVNSDLQIRLHNLEVHNKYLMEQISTNSTQLKRKSSTDELIYQHQQIKKFIVEWDDDDDDDCVIVTNDDNC